MKENLMRRAYGKVSRGLDKYLDARSHGCVMPIKKEALTVEGQNLERDARGGGKLGFLTTLALEGIYYSQMLTDPAAVETLKRYPVVAIGTAYIALRVADTLGSLLGSIGGYSVGCAKSKIKSFLNKRQTNKIKS